MGLQCCTMGGAWTEVEMGQDPQQRRKVQECDEEFCILVCATANVLTLHPAEERLNTTVSKLDSHRILDMASQFMATSVTVIWPSRNPFECCASCGHWPVSHLCSRNKSKGPGWC